MLKGLGGLGGLGDLTKMVQAAKDMKGRVSQLQDELASIIVEGQSGGGLVKAKANAKGDLTGLDIDPSIFVASEKEVVEDLILAAIKDAQRAAEDRSRQEMERVSREMGLPADMKFPF